jgi:hypothetical protein
MDEIAQIPSGSEEDRAEQQRFFDLGEAALVIDNSAVRVVIPRTETAAQYFGRNTRWCTSAKTSNQFASYNRQGPLYIILFKKNNVRWQWHFQAEQFMNERDEDNKDMVEMALPQYPELMEIWDAGWRDQLQKFISLPATGNYSATFPVYCLKHMFKPTLDDFKLVLNSPLPIKMTTIIKGDTWNLVHPTQFTELMEYVRQLWFEKYGNHGLNSPDAAPY